MAVRIGSDDDVRELRRLRQPPLGLDVDLIGAAARIRRLAERAGGNLDVLGAQSRDDFAGGEVEGRGAARVDPDAHRIVARSEQPDVADPVDPAEAVAHLGESVIGDVAPVERVVRRDEVHHHQEVGRSLAGDDPEPLDVGGEAGHGDGDPVLDEDLRRVEVGPLPEGDGDRHRAVARRLGRQIDHVVDPVYLLLDRRRDGFRHRLGGRSGVDGADRHGRRDDVGILGHRKAEIGEPPDHRDDHRDDGREDRPGDEELREAHDLTPDRKAAR